MNETNSKANDDIKTSSSSSSSHLSSNSILISKEDSLVETDQTTTTTAASLTLANINKANSFILAANQRLNVLNLKEILQLFNCAISQEQAWAVLYQTLNGLKYLFKYNLDLIKLNVDNIIIELLYFNKDGNILFGFKNRVEASNVVVLGNDCLKLFDH